MRCRRCHRPIRTGEYGPVCARIIAAETALFDLAEYPAAADTPANPPKPAPPIRPLLVRFDLFRRPSLDGLSEVEKHRKICETLGLW
jgi:hypothetical protein